jgi:molybdenum cofactor biosynthesis protein B
VTEHSSAGATASAGRHHLDGSRSLGAVIISVSDTHTEEDDVSGHLARQLLTDRGHKVLHYQLVANSVADVREALEPFLAKREVDLAITVGGTGVSSRDLTVNALESMAGRPLDGFGQLYRALSFQEVGALAMMSRATLFLIRQKPVFALPGSERAVRTAMEKLILPAAQHLVEELER